MTLGLTGPGGRVALTPMWFYYEGDKVLDSGPGALPVSRRTGSSTCRVSTRQRSLSLTAMASSSCDIFRRIFPSLPDSSGLWMPPSLVRRISRAVPTAYLKNPPIQAVMEVVLEAHLAVRANLRAHSFMPPLDLTKSVRR